jgi:protein O-GlcNAc transferase
MLTNAFKALQEDDLIRAESILLKLLHSDPQNPTALELMGVVYGKQNQLEESLFFFKKCLQYTPGSYSLFFNSAKALHELKRYNEAIEYHKKAIQFDIRNYEPWLNYGLSLAALQRWDDALECYEVALMLKPDLAPAWFNKGVAYNSMQQYQNALDSYRVYSSLDVRKGFTWGLIFMLQMRLCNWLEYDDILLKIEQGLVINKSIADPYPILLIDKPLLALKAAEIYSNDLYPLISREGIGQGYSHQKMRIGYFSADFRDHPVAQLIAELFELHDRSRFELYAFSLRDPDQDNAIRSRIKNSFEHFYEVENKTDQEIAQLARDLEIDIAINLGGYTQFERTGIFACRAAPIQVNYLGYPGTMGASYIDYIVADPTVIPISHQEFFSEKVVYLPDVYLPNDRKRQISTKVFTRAQLGLPDQGFVFCCFNNNFKINPSVFDGWARILSQVPGSVLWLRDCSLKVKENLIYEASLRDIEEKRLIFADRIVETSEHLARHAHADLFLDTFPYNAHTTASDALWAGLPVLTRIGQTFASRVAASLLQAIDLSELITKTQEDYELLAVELATHPEKLQEIKEKLKINRLTKPLFDAERYTIHLEAAYLKMYERYRADLRPEHIFV